MWWLTGAAPARRVGRPAGLFGPPVGAAGVLPRGAPLRRGRSRAWAALARPRLGPRAGWSWGPPCAGLRVAPVGLGPPLPVSVRPPRPVRPAPGPPPPGPIGRPAKGMGRRAFSVRGRLGAAQAPPSDQPPPPDVGVFRPQLVASWFLVGCRGCRCLGPGALPPAAGTVKGPDERRAAPPLTVPAGRRLSVVKRAARGCAGVPATFGFSGFGENAWFSRSFWSKMTEERGKTTRNRRRHQWRNVIHPARSCRRQDAEIVIHGGS